MNEYENLLIEQNNEIKQEWGKIFKKLDEFLPEPPQLRQPIKKEDFKSKYLKAIDAFDDFLDKNNITHMYYKYKEKYDAFKELYADGRLPKEMNKYIYLIILAFLAILEVPVNYVSINNFIHKPIISLFGALAIGMLLVFLAHYIGKFFKQLKFILSTPDAEDNLELPSRKVEILKFVASLVAFSGLFYFLYKIRTQYYVSLLGDDFDVVALSNVTTKVLINMAINVAIFLLGAIVSYIFHDPIPMYQETYYKMKKYLKIIQKRYEKLLKELLRIEKRNAIK